MQTAKDSVRASERNKRGSFVGLDLVRVTAAGYAASFRRSTAARVGRLFVARCRQTHSSFSFPLRIRQSRFLYAHASQGPAIASQPIPSQSQSRSKWEAAGETTRKEGPREELSMHLHIQGLEWDPRKTRRKKEEEKNKDHANPVRRAPWCSSILDQGTGRRRDTLCWVGAVWIANGERRLGSCAAEMHLMGSWDRTWEQQRWALAGRGLM